MQQDLLTIYNLSNENVHLINNELYFFEVRNCKKLFQNFFTDFYVELVGIRIGWLCVRTKIRQSETMTGSGSATLTGRVT
jgi:hypothetical protein